MAPRRITEQTTLGELAVQRVMLGVLALTLMRDLNGHLTAVVQSTSGLHVGQGATEAAAIDAAFTSLRLAMLPDALKALINEPRFNYPGTLCERKEPWGMIVCMHCGLGYTDHGAPEAIAKQFNVPDDKRHLICRVLKVTP